MRKSCRPSDFTPRPFRSRAPHKGVCFRATGIRASGFRSAHKGLPVWSRHVGDPILESNVTRRVDFALFMVEALENDELVHEAPAIVGRQTPSALAYAAGD
jgi:hypothetical protein